MIMEMFPTDPPARTTFRDVKTEYELLQMFSEWGSDARMKMGFSSGCSCIQRGQTCAKCNFHATLIAELQIDLLQVQDENGAVDQALTPLQLWQWKYLDMDGELTFARRELDRGRNIFSGPGGEQARARYAARLEPIPKDNVVTWVHYRLGENGDGTERIRQELETGEDVFSATFLGGIEARVKWGFVMWERLLAYTEGSLLYEYEPVPDTEWITLSRSGSLTSRREKGRKKVEQALLAGIDVFRCYQKKDYTVHTPWPEWACASAEQKYAHLAGIPGRLPKHNIETWEWFHIDESRGGIPKVKERLSHGEQLFEPHYFGGLRARAKWGFLEWELNSLEKYSVLSTIKEAVQEGVDMSIFMSRASKMPHNSWAADSARARYTSLFLERPPKHDLETWEWFHMDEDGTGTTRIEEKLRTGHMLFATERFGGVAARRKYGHLASDWMTKDWSEEDRRAWRKAHS